MRIWSDHDISFNRSFLIDRRFEAIYLVWGCHFAISYPTPSMSVAHLTSITSVEESANTRINATRQSPVPRCEFPESQCRLQHVAISRQEWRGANWIAHHTRETIEDVILQVRGVVIKDVTCHVTLGYKMVGWTCLAQYLRVSHSQQRPSPTKGKPPTPTRHTSPVLAPVYTHRKSTTSTMADISMYLNQTSNLDYPPNVTIATPAISSERSSLEVDFPWLVPSSADSLAHLEAGVDTGSLIHTPITTSSFVGLLEEFLDFGPAEGLSGSDGEWKHLIARFTLKWFRIIGLIIAISQLLNFNAWKNEWV